MDGFHAARLRAALEQARLEAARRGHDRIATRHLLLGMLTAEEGLAVVLLAGLGVDCDELRTRVERSLPRSRRATDPGALPYSANAARALERAELEAAELGGPAVRTEHLLLALLAGGGGLARMLRRLGITRTRALAELHRLLGVPDPADAAIAIDDSDATPVYQQIIDQVRTAVALGRLAPDDRLPTVRQLAADLGVAPGTVARAYQELEQLGCVVTDGSKGTRIAPARPVELSSYARSARLVSLMRPIVVTASHLGA
ncbi:MAG TPA: Clp protease N-terminal domain-containing protein, partial [Gemmatimonadales bacterium]|nr:Clp protease N-terminal domain-containing protein [Gemmatimonadales bacterium]